MMGKREISPAEGISADRFLDLMGEPMRGIVSRIRAEKDDGTRLLPSKTLIDRSVMLTPGKRAALLDKVAEMVDENLSGRSEMCLQFAELLNLALRHLGFNSFAVMGTATYLNAKGKRVFQWKHAWVRIGKELVDGNTDSVKENIVVPKTVDAAPYWGPYADVPGRVFKQTGDVETDSDVQKVWWPELKNWLEKDFAGIS
jgi:hypothetical protein